MPKYKCNNESCKLFGEEKIVVGTKIRISGDKSFDENAACPECGLTRETVRESGMTINIAGTNDQRNRMAKQW